MLPEIPNIDTHAGSLRESCSFVFFSLLRRNHKKEIAGTSVDVDLIRS